RPPLSPTPLPYTTLFRSQVPSAGNPLEVVRAERFEHQHLPRDRRDDRLGHHDLTRAAHRHDPARDVDREPRNVIPATIDVADVQDRKSTRLNSSHVSISY